VFEIKFAAINEQYKIHKKIIDGRIRKINIDIIIHQRKKKYTKR